MVLVTHVVSELMRPVPHPGVLRWLDAQVPGELWLTAVVAAELMFGVARRPETPRKLQLALAQALCRSGAGVDQSVGGVTPMMRRLTAVLLPNAVRPESFV
jgi:predicted nucleic acid-binding protein